jgi:hypothetical protein
MDGTGNKQAVLPKPDELDASLEGYGQGHNGNFNLPTHWTFSVFITFLHFCTGNPGEPISYSVPDLSA